MSADDRVETAFATLRETAANSIARMDAAEEAADVLVHWYRTGLAMHPSEFERRREAVEAWEAVR